MKKATKNDLRRRTCSQKTDVPHIFYGVLSVTQSFLLELSLKLVSIMFYQIFIFSSSDRSSNTLKNVFYFILKALFVLEIFKFLQFFPFISTMSRFKRANGCGIICVINWLPYICRYNFQNNSKTAFYYTIKLGQIIHN